MGRCDFHYRVLLLATLYLFSLPWPIEWSIHFPPLFLLFIALIIGLELDDVCSSFLQTASPGRKLSVTDFYTCQWIVSYNQLKHFYESGLNSIIVSLILNYCRPTYSIILLIAEPIGYNWLLTSAILKWITVISRSSSNIEFSGLINEDVQKGEH